MSVYNNREILNSNPLLPYGSRESGMDAGVPLPTVGAAEAWPISDWTNVPITPNGYRDGVGRLASQGVIGPHYLWQYLQNGDNYDDR